MKKQYITVIGAIALLGAGPVSADCSIKVASAANDPTLVEPGYFDVGAGFSIIPKATKSGNDSTGITGSFKAYPLARWYTTKKPASQQISAAANDVAAASEKLSAAKDSLDKAKGAADDSKKKADLQDPVASAETVNAANKVNEAAAQTKAAADSVTVAVNKARDAFKDIPMERTLFPIKDASCLSRFAFNYNRSISGFDGISGAVDAVGLSFDITPEFAIYASRAFYKEKETVAGSGEDTRAKWMFGIEMNLNAFSAFRSLAGGN